MSVSADFHRDLGRPRDVALSLFPEIKPDRPIGPILPSVLPGTNADLIARVAPMYLEGNTVLDVTYGEGSWWKRYRPVGLRTHDIDLAKGDGVDFRALPEADHSVDVVCYDPPYIPQGGVTTSTAGSFIGDYGLQSRSRQELWDLIDAGLAECARVARRWVLVKCCDFVNGDNFWLGHLRIIRMAEAHGLVDAFGEPHDLIIHHSGSGPGGHNVFVPIRARRHHSYLIVFEAPAKARREVA